MKTQQNEYNSRIISINTISSSRLKIMFFVRNKKKLSINIRTVHASNTNLPPFYEHPTIKVFLSTVGIKVLGGYNKKITKNYLQRGLNWRSASLLTIVAAPTDF